MKLFFSPNSPYARKCRVVILEKGLEGIELVSLMPSDNPPELWAVNPLGTVPALVTRDGLHLCESPVICEYLDGLPSGAARLLPEQDRVCILALAALADGIMDAAVTCVMEGRRPQERQWQAMVERKQNAILRAIDKISKVKFDLSAPLTLGTLNTAIALLYVDFRLPHLPWRSEHPALAAWVDAINRRPSFTATLPQ